MTTRQATDRLRSIEDGIASLETCNARIRDMEREEAADALGARRPFYYATPFAGRVRVTSMDALEYLMRGGVAHAAAPVAPLPLAPHKPNALRDKLVKAGLLRPALG
jgi:hypothetical protein